MHGPGHRVLVDADSRSEHPRHDVDSVAVGARGHGRAVDDRLQPAEVRRERLDLGSRGDLDDEPLLVVEDRDRVGDPERVQQSGSRLHRCRRDRGEVHLDVPARPPAAGERARQGVEGHGVDRTPGLEQRVCGCERGVAAERDLHGRCEPPEVVVAVGTGYDVRGLGETELEGQRLHRRLGQRGVEETDRGGVPAEGRVGERVDPDQGRAHPPTVPERAPRQPMTTRTSPAPTVSPAAARISCTVPSTSAAMWFSIFIASSTSSDAPATTA